jgi:hypothetical protein
LVQVGACGIDAVEVETDAKRRDLQNLITGAQLFLASQLALQMPVKKGTDYKSAPAAVRPYKGN